MERRKFLKSASAVTGGVAVAAGGLASSLPAPAIASGKRQLTMIMPWPRSTPGLGVNAQRFAEHLAVMTDNSLSIKLYGAGELVPPFECLDAVSDRTADLAHSTPYYWVGKSKAMHYFTGVPFGLTAQELSAWIRFGGGLELWQELYKPFGVTPFYAGSSGTQAGGWYNKEINSVDDLNGLKFRIAGLGAEVMKRLGAVTVMTPPGEIAPSLMSGAVDGADWVGPWMDRAFGLHKAAKYYYMPGLHEPGPGLEILVNSELLAELTEAQRMAITMAASATAERTLADFTFNNIEAFEPLLAEGVELRSFPEDVSRAFYEKSNEILAEMAAEDPLTGKIHTSYMAFLKKARTYAAHAEGGILQARNLVAG